MQLPRPTQDGRCSTRMIGATWAPCDPSSADSSLARSFRSSRSCPPATPWRDRTMNSQRPPRAPMTPRAYLRKARWRALTERSWKRRRVRFNRYCPASTSSESVSSTTSARRAARKNARSLSVSANCGTTPAAQWPNRNAASHSERVNASMRCLCAPTASQVPLRRQNRRKRTIRPTHCSRRWTPTAARRSGPPFRRSKSHVAICRANVAAARHPEPTRALSLQWVPRPRNNAETSRLPGAWRQTETVRSGGRVSCSLILMETP